MKLRHFIKLVLPFFPLILSILGICFVMYTLQNFLPENSQKQLDTVLFLMTIVSSLFSIVLFGFIIKKVSTYKMISDELQKEIKTLTKQTHLFRDLADILLASDLWAPGLKEYIEREFAGLNYFDIKEFYRGRNKLALEYIEQNNRFGETESLYLEIKSLLLNDPAQSAVDGYSNPEEYNKRILRKWDEHNVGNGIYHYFGFKYINFKDELDVSRIQEQHQDRILDCAIQIDSRRYQDLGFSEELLSKLGAQLSEETIPYLLSATQESVRKVPNVIKIAFILMATLMIFGVFLPIMILLLSLDPFMSIVSIGMVSGIFIFLLLVIYPYINWEINKVYT